MGIPATIRQAMLASQFAGATHLSIHSANPGTTGTNEFADTRTAVTLVWSTDHYENSAHVNFPEMVAESVITHVGCWDDSTFLGHQELLTLDGEEYVAAPVTITAGNYYRQAAGTFKVNQADTTITVG